MSDDLNLLPCPFCGGEAEWKVGGPGCAFIKCKSCPAETSDGSVPRIAKAWNTRAEAAEAKLVKAAEALESVAGVGFDAPMTWAGTDAEWERRRANIMQSIARAALAELEEQTDE